MKKLVFAFLAILAVGMASSCSSKADKLREQQIADSLRKDSIARVMREDSIQKAQREEELKEQKIAFLKQFYANVVYSVDANLGSDEAFAKNFTRHLSDKVKKALTDYDDGIEDGSEMSKSSSPQYYLFGDEGDYGNEGPKITYTYEDNGWFKVTIAGSTTVKIKVDSDKDDDENFIITGVEIPNYNISVKP